MTIYLLRHADASNIAVSDFARQLTSKGVEQSGRVAEFCKRHGIRPGIVLASPLARAKQTAALVAEAVGADLLEQPWLACGMSPDKALRELAAFREFAEVMLVGHEPDFGALAAHLLGTSSSGNVHIRKASLTRIDADSPGRGTGTLAFSIPVKYMQ